MCDSDDRLRVEEPPVVDQEVCGGVLEPVAVEESLPAHIKGLQHGSVDSVARDLSQAHRCSLPYYSSVGSDSVI